MERAIIAKLLEWKDSSRRKPLLLTGARQVGKTYILKKFAEEHFDSSHYFNFEKNPELGLIFETNLDTERILNELGLAAGQAIQNDSLLIFDEIQACPKATNSLKYFSENKPELCLVAAGSLLGLQLNDTSFPVGKVDRLWMGPLKFSEFLAGIGDEQGVGAFEEITEKGDMSAFAHQYLWEKFKLFTAVGGLPAVINSYRENSDDLVEALGGARKTQQALIKDYLADIAKHSGKNDSMHIHSVLENIPSQLGESLEDGAKKFRFKNVVAGKKGFAELRGPIQWLIKAGLVYQIKIANMPQFPIETYCQDNFFRLYLFDVGILGALSNIPIEVVYINDYGQSKGVFAENTCLQLMTEDENHGIYAWRNNSAEIEFLRIINEQIIPVEVKASHRTRAKSLQSYIKRYSPKYSFLLSANKFTVSKEDRKIWAPIYLSEKIAYLAECVRLDEP